MGVEKHNDFLKRYGSSMLLAVDQFLPENSAAFEEFYREVYVRFEEEDEQAVYNAVHDADRFMVVTAPIGGGKSTIIYRALQGMRTETRDYFVFDFKRQISSFYGMSGKSRDKMHFMHERFKDSLMNAFLPTFAKKLEFVFITLLKYFIHERHLMEVRWAKLSPGLKADASIDEMKKYFLRDPQAQEIGLKLVSEKLTCAQMIMALKDSLKLNKFLLVLDNVDRCPAIDQPALFSLAIDINHEGLGRFGTIVAVRNKNLMRFEEAGSDGDVISIVSISLEIEVRTKPLRLIPPSSERAKDILWKRQEHALKLQTSSTSGFASSADIFRQIRSYVNDTMIKERFQNLSNHSYRRMLVMHDGFVRYLFRLVEAGTLKVEKGRINLNEWKTRSYLYRWLYATNNPDHKFLLDVVGRYKVYSPKTDDLPLMCDVELVVLAWMVNNRGRILRMDDLTRSFRKLAVGMDFIREGIYRLYPRKAIIRHIELGESEELATKESLKVPKCRLSLTPLGSEFVLNTITKFEFLHQCLAYPVVTNEDSEVMLQPVESDIDTKIARVFSFLETMRKVHQEALLEFREKWHYTDENWEEYYRRTFCVRDLLILERIASSHLSYFRNQFPASYDMWKPKYFDLVDEYLCAVKSSRNVKQSLHGV